MGDSPGKEDGCPGWGCFGPHVHMAAELCLAHKACVPPWGPGLESGWTPSGKYNMAAWPGAGLKWSPGKGAEVPGRAAWRDGGIALRGSQGSGV